MADAVEAVEDLTPREIVAELDKYIVGQKNAKRAVAVALRNRYRRRLLGDDLRDEVIPKNILMIGPTGVGKTEIARRLATLARAPFVKVEATKFPEVGYVGRDVDSMVRDLVQVAIRLVEAEKIALVQPAAQERAVARIVNLLQPERAPGARGKRGSADDVPDMARNLRDLYAQMFPNIEPNGNAVLLNANASQEGKGETATADKPERPASDGPAANAQSEEEAKDAARRERIRDRLRVQVANGALDAQELEISIEESQPSPFMQVFSNQGSDDMGMDMQNALGGLMPRKQKKRKVTIGEAKKIFGDEEAQNLIDRDSLNREAITRAEQSGIIFVDEIDKIASGRGPGGGSGPDVSREGVQRDILPIIEGSTINTKFGPVRTDHILFIAAGAFHVSKPSDLIPELQGRLPIRVELENLTEGDFQRILTEPRNALTRQYTALLATEGVQVEFGVDAIAELARIAAQVNRTSENIGARRLHTLLERLLEDVSFDAPDLSDKSIHVDAAYVHRRLDDIVKDEDLSRYIL